MQNEDMPYVYFYDLDEKRDEKRESKREQSKDMLSIIYNIFFSTGIETNKQKAT